MIGQLVSMHYIGKRRWMESLIYWALVFVAGILVSYLIPSSGIPGFSFIVGAFVAVLLAHYWVKLNWKLSIEVWAVGFVIDIIIILALMAVLGATIGIWFGLGGLF